LPATTVTGSAVRSYRTFSPLPSFARQAFRSGELRRAVFFLCHWSVRLLCPGVTRRTALRSSDFPPASAVGRGLSTAARTKAGDRPADCDTPIMARRRDSATGW